MNIKRILLLASLTLAVAAVAVPAVASAAEIKDAGKQLDNREIEITGNVKTVNAFNQGFECTVHARILVNKATIEVKKFEATASTCVVIGVTFKNCIMKSTQTTAIPWAVKANAMSLTLETGLVDGELESKVGTVCPTKTLDNTIKDVSLTPDNANAIKCFFISGEVIVDMDAGKQEKTEVFGTLAVVGADSGTFEYV